MNKLLCEKNAACLCDGGWRSAQMFLEQPSEMPFTNAKSIGEHLYASVGLVEKSFSNQCKAARDGVRCSPPACHLR